ncbi:ATP-binding cassette domain-containing protein [Shinella curvata]|uniref:ATP-binding cassette domain-containing protein n=1 Tax=Shinella curvata TaxID=1817964 RepID=A0ABT8X8C4_9HYPH|nr:ABC-F family ATP-binding cassette domain-containing protein [Shinella curvata]MCJ8052083.1 ATP-binding cassette domain-containing protein [Shinella curvata]MDO6119969.1 ATP-binding cassette domain-containing protein [Shinella curvata]
MPSITLSKISWSTPDGHALLSNIDLSFGRERAGLVGRNGVGKTTLLRLTAGDLQPLAGGISIDGTIGVLRQSVQVGPHETIASLFGIEEALDLLRRAERGEADAETLMEADWTLEPRLDAALARVGLAAHAATHLAALSGGQRTRAALAALLFSEPDFLLLDEPTNNLDRDGRQAVIDMLAGWRAGAVVVSHDRELLDTMDAIVELTSLGATRYSGNWSAYRARKALELAAAQHDLSHAEKHAAEVSRTMQVVAERKARKDSAGRRKRARGDIPRIMLGAMKERSELTSGANVRLAESRQAQATGAVVAARERIEILQPFTVSVPSTHLAAGKTVLKIDTVTAGYVPERPVLRDLSLAITGPERLAVTGPNGSGKTTLLRLVTGQVQPLQGSVCVFTDFALLDQRVSLLDAGLSIRDNFRRLNPETDENDCRAALARFMFRADAALQIAGSLSGGQLLRAGLACVLGGGRPPPLLILDEPTNHLDISSIEAVEAGLRAYDGALLVVSHDESFLQAIAITRRLALVAAV